ncbi:MAG: MFS transporter [Acidiferrobacteraceae bacterium]
MDMNADPAIAPKPARVWLLAFAAGITVANLYYSQPLLSLMAASFHLSPAGITLMPMVTQIGYALGLLLLVPLGDSHERKHLIVRTTLALSVALVAVAAASGVASLMAASLALGILTITPQLLVPFAATLAPPARRGQVVGIVMSGLLIGIILSRSISGAASAYVNWRFIYLGAAVANLALGAALAALLPKQMPSERLSYLNLLRSLTGLVRGEPVLRRHMAVGAFGFAAFSIFWTTLIFHAARLAPGHGARIVGIFGLFGVAGALAAPISGRLSDRIVAVRVNGLSLLMVLVAFGVLWRGAHSLALLALGVVLLDAGVQANHISNQTRIYNLHPEKRSRLNAAYMTAYFIGGASGSAVGGFIWSHLHWAGVCAGGALFVLCALVSLFTVGREAKAACA